MRKHRNAGAEAAQAMLKADLSSGFGWGCAEVKWSEVTDFVDRSVLVPIVVRPGAPFVASERSVRSDARSP